MFSPNQWGQIIISDVGVVIWLVALYFSIGKFGFFEVFRTYLVPYLWYVALASPNQDFRPILSQG
jgi:omega-6 fatty acid desaturase (delta-12 desaturase)